MMNKASFAILLVVGLAAIATVPTGGNAAVFKANATNSSHNLIVGSRVYGDRLLSQQVVTKTSSFLQIVTKEVPFKTSNYETISQIRALDQKTNGNGAYASITSGGPGNRNTTIRFKSQRGHGISFILEIYGR